jgi:ABC-2 type transport system ATP-binding protein
MEVAETMCTRIGIVSSGRVVAEGTMDELRTLSGRRDSSLEDLFLKLTDEEKFVADAIGRLREDSQRGSW